MGASGEYQFKPITGNRMTWLMLETACFYTYMVAAITYILIRSLMSACGSASPVTDRQKVMTDYIYYSRHNITWFALNFTLCFMPVICMLLIG
mmetsp:Transcript_14310/g.18040  ORF Transcript_14310/g.18040 Transcript_14310/m.18040 type:complete len:93 (+) Transcript_14310:372-650(+)